MGGWQRQSMCVGLTAVLLTGLATVAAEAAPEPFRDGDRVCFVGDSITHGGGYHSYLVLFYATRFPERRLEFINAGISGDSAAGAVRRFDWDIAPQAPTVATLMLGMNDVNRGLYGPDPADAARRQRRQAALDQYAAGMRRLAEALRDQGSRLIFITPSIYDQTSTMDTPNLVGVNDALGLCAERARSLAAEFGGSVVDFHGPMTRINAAYQQGDPAATIVGKDRVHPGPPGHLVMAYLFLRAQGLSPYVSKTVIDARAGTVAEALNAGVSELVATPERVTFVSLEQALPFPVPAAAAGALKLVPFMADLNQQILVVRDLAAGTYELQIDEGVVGPYTAAELATGIDLAGNERTPQHRQAQTVAAANDRRHGLIAGKLRSFALTETYLRTVKDLDLQDPNAVTRVLTERLEKMKAAGSPTAGYYEGQTRLYLAEKGREEEYRQAATAAFAAMRAASRPIPHRYALTRQP